MGGRTWAPLQTGLPDAPVFDLQIHPTARLLRASLHGRGLFEWKLDAPGSLMSTCTSAIRTSTPAEGRTPMAGPTRPWRRPDSWPTICRPTSRSTYRPRRVTRRLRRTSTLRRSTKRSSTAATGSERCPHRRRCIIGSTSRCTTGAESTPPTSRSWRPSPTPRPASSCRPDSPRTWWPGRRCPGPSGPLFRLLSSQRFAPDFPVSPSSTCPRLCCRCRRACRGARTTAWLCSCTQPRIPLRAPSAM